MYFLEGNNALFQNLAVQQLLVGLHCLVKGEVVGNKVLNVQLAGAHPLYHLGVGLAFLALAGHLLVNDAPVVVGRAEVDGDLLLFGHAVAQH